MAGKPKPLPPGGLAGLKTAYEAGGSIASLAAYHGASAERMRKLLIAAGTRFRSHGGPRGGPQRPCGTIAGYQHHRRRAQRPCLECFQGMRAYNAVLRAAARRLAEEYPAEFAAHRLRCQAQRVAGNNLARRARGELRRAHPERYAQIVAELRAQAAAP